MNNDNLITIAVLLVLFIIFLLLIWFLSNLKNTETVQKKASGSKNDGEKRVKPCPLCGELLTKSEKVHSVLYPGKPDSLMEIFGCPHCRFPDSEKSRTCPVCRKKMPSDSFLIARVFEKPGKTHVHVLGCTECYKGRTRINNN